MYLGVFVLHIIYFLIAPVAIPLVFIIILNMPRFSASNRGASIEIELPFVIGYLSVLAGGGVSPVATLRRIAKMKLFPATAKEAKRILVQTEVFGDDPITAMEYVAKSNPCRNWSEFLLGYTSVLKSGGDFVAYIQTKLKDILEAKSQSVKRSADTTGTMAEAYLTITVILGMTLYTLYMIQVLISHNLSGLVSLYLFAFLIVPLISAGFIYLLDAVQPKWPYTDYRPYKSLLITAPLGAVFFFLPIPIIPLYMKTSIALIIGASAPAFFSSRYSRERMSLERALPDFIRDVAEGRKTGLSPEKAIERLVDRRYGLFSKYVRVMGSQLSWGVDLNKVVSTFTDNVGSWITRAVGTLLIEVVDVGGGTIRSFSEMATFTRTINDMERDRRAALRAFVMIAYVAGVMVIMTTFIMVYLLGEPAARGFGGATAIPASTIDLLLVTAVFDSFVIGMVAGKMGEASVSDGFKHGIALVIISVIAVAVAKLFIPIPVL
jgi:archaeal flagellar protein FlaJ